MKVLVKVLMKLLMRLLMQMHELYQARLMQLPTHLLPLLLLLLAGALLASHLLPSAALQALSHTEREDSGILRSEGLTLIHMLVIWEGG